MQCHSPISFSGVSTLKERTLKCKKCGLEFKFDINHEQFKNVVGIEEIEKKENVSNAKLEKSRGEGGQAMELKLEISKYHRYTEDFSNLEQSLSDTDQLEEAKEKGIKVFGFIAPVFPGITNLDELFKELGFCKYVWVELLNLKYSVMNRLMPVIKKEFPDNVKDFEFAINHPGEYYRKIKQEVAVLEKKYKLRVRKVIVHS